MSRRPITAAGKRPRYSYSSTLFYSGIFAAAATTDAASKQKRRQRWEKAIAEVREEIGGEENLPQSHSQAEEQKREFAKDHVVDEPEAEGRVWTQSRLSIAREDAEPEALYEDATTTYTTGFPTNTGAPLVRHNLPPQSEHAPLHYRDRALRRRWTPKKLRTTELSVDRMILRIILFLDDTRQLAAAIPSAPASLQPLLRTPRPQLEELLKLTEHRLFSLWAADPWLTTHPDNLDLITPIHAHSAQFVQHESDDSHIYTSDALRISINEIFRARSTASQTPPLAETLLKLCHNLSVSPAPPLLSVWNTLLRNLSSPSICSPLPASFVIEAIRSAHIRVNEDTLIAVLNHCITTSKSHLFTKVVRLMNGQHGGWALARPDINITATGGADRLVRISEDKVVQNPYPTPRVFETLIKGVLHFAGFDAALGVCRDMGFRGWGLSIRGLVPLLRDCVKREDWERGEGVWKQILVLREKSRRDGRSEALPLGALVEALKMTEAQKKGVEFFEIVDLAKAGGWEKDELLKRVRESKVVEGVAKIRKVIPEKDVVSGFRRVRAGREENSEQANAELRRTTPAGAQQSGKIVEEELDIPQPPRMQQPLSKASPALPVERGHLEGDFMATTELDEYEARERPMSLSG